jgi:hypothetical protein
MGQVKDEEPTVSTADLEHADVEDVGPIVPPSPRFSTGLTDISHLRITAGYTTIHRLDFPSPDFQEFLSSRDPREDIDDEWTLPGQNIE